MTTAQASTSPRRLSARSASFGVALFSSASRKLGSAKKARLQDNDQIIDFLQPRTEPRHDHRCNFITESQEVDRNTEMTDSTKLLVIRVVVAFLLHAGRMSCLSAAGAVALPELNTGHK